MRKKKSGASKFQGMSHEQNVDFSQSRNKGPGGNPGSFKGHMENNLEGAETKGGPKGGGSKKKNRRY